MAKEPVNPTCAFLFPGQGAQFLGMAVDLVSAYAEARAIFEAGREILGRDFVNVCRQGPEEDLNSTRTSQPAIFLHSMAVLEVLRKCWGVKERFCRGVATIGTAGLSLGEYSALVFAGSLEFEDALRIVAKRGEYMQKACDAARGTMASIFGLGAEKVEEVISRARSDGLRVNVANYNSPEQTVISGEEGAVEDVMTRLQAAGAKRAVRLKVAGAYHSGLMAPATRELEPLLKEMTIRRPGVPFFANTTGAEVSDPEVIRRGLILQIESPVRWRQTLDALLERGVTAALELGPGQVIRGLLRSMSRDVQVTPVGTGGDVEKLTSKEESRQ